MIAITREKSRTGKLVTNNPKMKYVIRTVGLLLQSV
jgi:hypothetical protein